MLSAACQWAPKLLRIPCEVAAKITDCKENRTHLKTGSKGTNVGKTSHLGSGNNGRCLFKTVAGTIKHKHGSDWQRRGSLLAACRQVGYFHCAASCVINSLCTESSDSSPRRHCGFFGWSFSLSLSSGFLAAQGHWMSVSPCVPPIFAAQIIHTVREWSPTGGGLCGLPSTRASTSVPQILHLIGRQHAASVDNPGDYQDTKQQHKKNKIDLFVSDSLETEVVGLFRY